MFVLLRDCVAQREDKETFFSHTNQAVSNSQVAKGEPRGSLGASFIPEAQV